jgi:hypothetical protein
MRVLPNVRQQVVCYGSAVSERTAHSEIWRMPSAHRLGGDDMNAAVREYYSSGKDRFLERLKEFLRIPSVSRL